MHQEQGGNHSNGGPGDGERRVEGEHQHHGGHNAEGPDRPSACQKSNARENYRGPYCPDHGGENDRLQRYWPRTLNGYILWHRSQPIRDEVHDVFATAAKIAANGPAHNRRRMATCPPCTWLLCASSIYYSSSVHEGLCLPPSCFGSNISGGKTCVIVSRAGFGMVRKTGFQPVQKYRWLRRFDQPTINGDPSCFGAIVSAELAEDRTDVELDGPFADK